jgi:polyphosphate kinase 2 (PPK2 family)
MPRKDVLNAIRKYTEPFRVTKGKDFRLKDFDPGDTRGLKMDKKEPAELLERGSEWLAMEQDVLYAQDSWAMLLVFQAMDAAGKDGTISTSFRASTLKGSMSFRSSSHPTRSCRTISYGAMPSKFRIAGASGS